MTEADRKAFDVWYEEEGQCLDEKSARIAWLAARDHYRKDVAELVDALEQAPHGFGCSMRCGKDRVIDPCNCWKSKIAAKLKEQPQ